MPLPSEAAALLPKVPNLTVIPRASLARYTRFGIGGPADLFCDALDEPALIEALLYANDANVPHLVIGGGTNLVVADEGYRGVVIRYSGAAIHHRETTLDVQAGAVLQDVVDRSVELGLGGLQTMTGIPGYLGGAVYGNAGAYGHSLSEIVRHVRFFDGNAIVQFNNAECRFLYRDSIFKDRKEWIVLSAELLFARGDPGELRKTASEIRTVRDAKYPPDMKCAGSIFKNLLFVHLPPEVAARVPSSVVREGKVPSAWFLEQAGVKGLRRGDIQVATYHANLIYNDGSGTAADLVWVIDELKRRVRELFGFDLEEEVQYVGF